tara:strand:- start:3997 stop:5742 length:1746 start_codon:yes stop_codon:yes gene_type:complete
MNTHQLKVIIILLLFTKVLFSQSIHEEQSTYYNSLGNLTDEQYDKLNDYSNTQTSPNRSNCNLDKIVFGWHPYWVGSAYLNYDWNLLSDFSYFSYEVNPSTGNANTTHNWATANSVDSALVNGVRVNLCVTLFSSHSTFFGSSISQQTLISNLISLVQSRGAHGVNIDFESMSSSHKTDFTNFMVDLSMQMHAAIPNSQVSVAIYAVDWSNLYDVATLAPYVDLFVMMGYGYYWTNSSTAGPTDPLYHYMSNSYKYSLSRSITYYLDKGLPPDQFVIGLPYYSRDWPVSSGTIPSPTTGVGSAKTYSQVRNNSGGYYNTKLWHNASKTPYYTYVDGSDIRQCFAIDDESFSERLQLIRRRGLAGMGMWALGYDNGYSNLWNGIENEFTDCRVEPCTDTLYDMGGEERNYYDREDYIYTLSATNGATIDLDFKSFDVELNYDYLRLYNGVDTSSPVIGVYTGTNSPNVINAGSDVTFWFYSDGATTNPGWEVVYECSTIVNISVKQNNNTKIYPSPFQEKINIENLKKNSTIGIYDALGKLLYKTTTVQSFVEIYLNDVSKGMYYVIVKNHNTNLIKRIVKI